MSEQSAWVRADDAQRDAKEAASMIAQHFKGEAYSVGNDDDVALFAALGFEGHARSILRHVDVIFESLQELQRELDALKASAATGKGRRR